MANPKEVSVLLNRDEIQLVQWFILNRDNIPGYPEFSKNLETRLGLRLGLKMLDAMDELEQRYRG